MLVYVVEISSEASHSLLMTKDIIPVVGKFATGAECGDVVLGYVDS